MLLTGHWCDDIISKNCVAKIFWNIIRWSNISGFSSRPLLAIFLRLCRSKTSWWGWLSFMITITIIAHDHYNQPDENQADQIIFTITIFSNHHSHHITIIIWSGENQADPDQRSSFVITITFIMITLMKSRLTPTRDLRHLWKLCKRPGWTRRSQTMTVSRKLQ